MSAKATLTKQQRAELDRRLARFDAAVKKVSARTSIDFVRSVRGK